MMIDELKMLEFYTSLFSGPPKGKIKSAAGVNGFDLPDTHLDNEQSTLLTLIGENKNILEELTEVFHKQGELELATATDKMSQFLKVHGAELASYLEPEYRVLDYVYPIV